MMMMTDPDDDSDGGVDFTDFMAITCEDDTRGCYLRW
jgi:hypothetical protein